MTVAQQISSDRVASAAVEGAWPRADRDAAAVGRIAIVQPATGAFRRGEATRTKGSLAVRESDSVRGDAPAAFVGMVCRGSGLPGSVTVERELRGETTVRFPEIQLEGKDDCAETRDLVRANTLGPGVFFYEVRVLEDGREIARGERGFRVSDATMAVRIRPSREGP
jgi:hypothetical protein